MSPEPQSWKSLLNLKEVGAAVGRQDFPAPDALPWKAHASPGKRKSPLGRPRARTGDPVVWKASGNRGCLKRIDQRDLAGNGFVR